MKRSAMRKLLLLTLGVTVMAAWFAPDRESDGIELSAHAKRAEAARPVVRPAQTPEAAPREKPIATAGVLQIRKRDDNEMDQAGSGLFTPTSWEMTSETSAVEPEPLSDIPEADTQAGLVPPPFVVLGRYEDENRSVVFLQYMDESLAVSEGDIIADNTFRVEKLEGDTLTLLNLPLNTIQTLDMGEVQ